MFSKFVEKYNKLYARNSEVENLLWTLMAALPTETKNDLSARFPWFKKIEELAAEREEYLRGPGLDLKDFDSKNLMMSVKYWPEDSGSPEIVQNVTSIQRDGKTGDFIIGTIFDDIRVHCDKFETVMEVGA